jgi:hypothetical protein
VGPEDLKWLIKRLFARMGFQISRISPGQTLEFHLRNLFTTLCISCVLDVGAHEGTYGRELRRLGYSGHIVSFEPVAENFAILARASSGDPRWRAFPYALGVPLAADAERLRSESLRGQAAPSANRARRD